MLTTSATIRSARRLVRDARTEAGQLLTEVILQVFRLRGRLVVAGDSLVADTGQTSARWQILGSTFYRSVTVAEVARRTGRRRQSIQDWPTGSSTTV